MMPKTQLMSEMMIAATTPHQKSSTRRPQLQKLVIQAVSHSRKRVDDEPDQPERQDVEREREDLDDGADERVHEGEDRRHEQEGEHDCRVSPGGNAMTVTCSAGIRVTTQIANALTTTRMRKRIVRPVSHAAERAGRPHETPRSLDSQGDRRPRSSPFACAPRSPPCRLPAGQAAGADAFKLSSNENPFEPLPGVLEAVQRRDGAQPLSGCHGRSPARAAGRALRRRRSTRCTSAPAACRSSPSSCSRRRARRRGRLRLAIVRGLPRARRGRRRDARAGAATARRAARPRRDGRGGHRPHARR